METADELVPALETVLRELQLAARDLRARFDDLARRNATITELALADAVKRHPELREPAARLAELAGKIESFGCFLKDIDLGLVDFPCEIDDDVVFLCWQSGEPRVIAWHPVEGGFADRKPLPGAPKRYLN
ncbi:MAG: DUF2203 domain-containing protein [Candidatus Binataceae bacterium]